LESYESGETYSGTHICPLGAIYRVRPANSSGIVSAGQTRKCMARVTGHTHGKHSFDISLRLFNVPN